MSFGLTMTLSRESPHTLSHTLFTLHIIPKKAYNLYFRKERPLLIARYEQGESQPDFDANIVKAVEAGKDKTKGAVFQAASKTLGKKTKQLRSEGNRKSPLALMFRVLLYSGEVENNDLARARSV